MPLIHDEGRPALAGGLDIDSLEQFWNDQVFGIASTFARLLFLSHLWNPGAGRYCEPTLEAGLGHDGADRVIRTTHEVTFARWLTLTLEEHRADIEIYLQRAEAVPSVRLRPESYRALIPESATEHERHLFLFDLAVVLELIQARPRRPEEASLRLVAVHA